MSHADPLPAGVQRAHRNAKRRVRALRVDLAETRCALARAQREAEVLRQGIVHLSRDALAESSRLTGGSRSYYEGYLAALRHLARFDPIAREALASVNNPR